MLEDQDFNSLKNPTVDLDRHDLNHRSHWYDYLDNPGAVHHG